VVKRRDIYDRPPLLKWTDGYTTLLGDAAHATMPNLGQGGAMAIEDAYVLGQELEGIQHTDEIPMRLKRFESRRFGAKSSIAQFLSRNGSDLLDGWEKLRTTPIGPIAMWFINVIQPITMNYLYSADF
jgi:zeaxanthin epoxidase